TRLIISDLSGPTDKGFLLYYPTDGEYKVTLSNYNEQTQNLIFDYSSFILLQAYESFTVFCKSLLSQYFSLYNNQAFRLRAVRLKKQNILTHFFKTLINNKGNEGKKDFNYFMENIYCGKNNSNLFKYLRKISGHYKQFEIVNNKKINLSDFYKVFAISRHVITHNGSKITDKLKGGLSKNQLKIFTYFINKECNKIELTQEKLSHILVLISEQAFLIYKSFSIESGLNWKILKNMK
ncbi:unnamed protein product, partial [marine sediment metagenome]